jgi:glycosyltransferase involved in cell wall biosynthesis
MQGPFISIVIPTYNSENFITKTLETVCSQTYNNYEVIISDDGSTDDTVETARAFFDRYGHRESKILINSHEGAAAARNRGIEVANGDWISFLDSDDLWFEKKLSMVADYILQNEVDVICHSVIEKSSEKEILVKRYDFHNYKLSPFLSLYRSNSLGTSAVTVKKNLLVEAGLFDESLPVAHDYDLWLRVAMIPNIRIGFIRDPLVYYITRQGNISSNVEQRLQCLLKIEKKYYKVLKRSSKCPWIERAHFRGKAFASSGLALIRTSNIRRGLVLLFAGLAWWPFRYDWICRIVIKTK